MANHLSDNQRDELHTRVLRAAARLFMEKGYAAATTRELAAKADIQVSAMNRAFGSKEHILAELVECVIKGDFSMAKGALSEQITDKILYYALEKAVQFYMAECSEPVRDLYCNAYSLSETSELILRSAAQRLAAVIFADYLPDFTLEDFYQLEVATGSIVRGYMTTDSEIIPVEKKVSLFLESALRLYRVPEEKILEAIDFVNSFDLYALARQTIRDMHELLG